MHPRRRAIAYAGSIVAAGAWPAAAAGLPAVSCATRLRVPDRELVRPASGQPTTRLHHVLVTGPVAALRLGFVNWIGSTPAPAGIVVRAAVELPSGRIVPASFGGAPSVRIPPDGLAVSDDLACTLAPGDVFATRTAVMPESVTWPADAEIAGGRFPDGFAVALPGADLVRAGTIPDAGRTVPGYGPSMILGVPSGPGTTAPAVAVVGDSIAFGAADGAGDAAGNRGFIERLLANRAGLLNLARNGDTASGFAASPARRLALLRQSGCDRAVVNYGTNDIASGHSAEMVKASLAAVWSILAAAGVRRIHQATLLPRTASATGYGLGAVQTSILGPAIRAEVNGWLRQGPPALAGLLDSAACAERDGLWREEDGALTDDGTHPNGHGAATLARRLNADAILAG